MKTSVVAKALKDSRFFKDFEESVIAEIADIGHLVTLEAGRHVFQQGDFGKHIHIIVSGHVSLERSTDLGDRAGRVVIRAAISSTNRTRKFQKNCLSSLSRLRKQ